MNFKKLITLFLIIISISVEAQLKLTAESKVSILTIGPGTSLNDAFGHNAIRIQDPVYKFDIVFDYGRYDFETENFYLKFAPHKNDGYARECIVVIDALIGIIVIGINYIFSISYILNVGAIAPSTLIFITGWITRKSKTSDQRINCRISKVLAKGQA